MAASDDRAAAEIATFGTTVEGLAEITSAEKDSAAGGSGATDERVGSTKCFTCKLRKPSGEILDCERRGAGRVGCGGEGGDSE